VAAAISGIEEMHSRHHSDSQQQHQQQQQQQQQQLNCGSIPALIS